MQCRWRLHFTFYNAEDCMDSIMDTDHRHLRVRFVSFSFPRILLVARKIHTTYCKNQNKPILLICTRHSNNQNISDHPVPQQSAHPQTGTPSLKQKIVRSKTVRKSQRKAFLKTEMKARRNIMALKLRAKKKQTQNP